MVAIHIPEDGATLPDKIPAIHNPATTINSPIIRASNIGTFVKGVDGFKTSLNMAYSKNVAGIKGAKTGETFTRLHRPPALSLFRAHPILRFIQGKRLYTTDAELITGKGNSKTSPEENLPVRWQQRIEQCEREFFLAKGEWCFAKYAFGLVGGGFLIKGFWDRSEHAQTRAEMHENLNKIRSEMNQKHNENTTRIDKIIAISSQKRFFF